MDHDFLKELTEAPSVATACGPVLSVLRRRLDGWDERHEPDGYSLFTLGLTGLKGVKMLLVAHVDEIGGCAYGPHAEGGYHTRIWGAAAATYAQAQMQGFDWLAQSAEEAFPVSAYLDAEDDDVRIRVEGARVRPYRTGLTFRTATTVTGDAIVGKALDPRITDACMAEAAIRLNRTDVAVLFVLAEECALDVARKAVTLLQREAPQLELVINADVPGSKNLGEARLDMPAIRVYEGRNLIDPSFGIRMSSTLASLGVPHHLTGAKSGSQTILFTPIARALSVALPSEGIHEASYRMSLTGAARCVDLVCAAAETWRTGALA
jgi:putative aminopeptidase FrvX